MNLYSLNPILALGAPPQQPGQPRNPTGDLLGMLGPLVIMVAMGYLLLIRPQQKRAKQLAAMLKTVKPGDKVVTSSGIVGVVVAVKEQTASIRSADTKLEVLKSTIAEITERDGDKPEVKS